MTNHNIVADVANLTRVSNKCLESLINVVNMSIGSAIVSAQLANEQDLVLNIGIGTLSINTTDGQSKFMPSKDLKNTIKQAMTDGIDSIAVAFEEAFTTKLNEACKEVI